MTAWHRKVGTVWILAAAFAASTHGGARSHGPSEKEGVAAKVFPRSPAATAVSSHGATITDIRLDNTIFTGSPNATGRWHGGNTIIGAVSNTPGVAARYTLSGKDAAFFQVVTGSGWQPAPHRRDPTLQTNGVVAGRTDGFAITITATPTAGGRSFAKPFTLRPPSAPANQGAVHQVAAPSSAASLQRIINGAAPGDTILFGAGKFKITGSVTLAAGLLYKGAGASRSILDFGGSGGWVINPTSYSHITIYGLQFQNAGTPMQLFGNNGDAASPRADIVITNCLFDNKNFHSGGDMLVLGSLNGLRVNWCTFQNGAGTGNNGGFNCSNVRWSRVAFLRCREAMGWSVGDGASRHSSANITAECCYFQSSYRAMLEWAPSGPRTTSSALKVLDCYFDGWDTTYGVGDFSACISIVPAGDVEIARSFGSCEGVFPHGWFAEVSATQAPPAGTNQGAWCYFHNNYDRDNERQLVDEYKGDANYLVINNNSFHISGGKASYANPPGTTQSGNTTRDWGKPPPLAAGCGP
jgi:hypothetical protein